MDPKEPTGFNTMSSHESSDSIEPSNFGDLKDSPAVELIRQKVESLYANEPSAGAEKTEIKNIPPSERSKHQQFMHDLGISGKSLAEIQTAWHNYYLNLPDEEKHDVWQEFYKEHDRSSHYARAVVALPSGQAGGRQAQHPHHPRPDQPKPDEPTKHKPKSHAGKLRTVSQLREHIAGTVNAESKIKTRQHLQSLMFGLGMGSLVVMVLLFGLFNERIIAPFISPSRRVSSTPIIVDQNKAGTFYPPVIVIPKINVEVPIIYSQKSVDEKAVQKSLESGVLHYPTTSDPGERGNAVFFGHSSSNIFNSGKYKFAFVLLRKLEVGDLFYVTKDSKRYVYKVYARKIVDPKEVSVLNNQTKLATATLITCDPPGTSKNRLVVFGEQVSPNPSKNKTSHVKSGQKPSVLPSNSESLLQKIKRWLIG